MTLFGYKKLKILGTLEVSMCFLTDAIEPRTKAVNALSAKTNLSTRDEDEHKMHVQRNNSGALALLLPTDFQFMNTTL
jgi:hypothetical protein